MILAALLVPGCGNGGDDTTVALTKAQYVERADSICQKGRDARDAAVAEGTQKVRGGGNFPQGKELEILVQETVPVIRAMAEELAALPAPAGDEEQVEAVASGFADFADFAEEDPLAAVEESEAKLSDTRKRAKAYGMGICAKY